MVHPILVTESVRLHTPLCNGWGLHHEEIFFVTFTLSPSLNHCGHRHHFFVPSRHGRLHQVLIKLCFHRDDEKARCLIHRLGHLIVHVQ